MDTTNLEDDVFLKLNAGESIKVGNCATIRAEKGGAKIEALDFLVATCGPNMNIIGKTMVHASVGLFSNVDAGNFSTIFAGEYCNVNVGDYSTIVALNGITFTTGKESKVIIEKLVLFEGIDFKAGETVNIKNIIKLMKERNKLSYKLKSVIKEIIKK